MRRTRSETDISDTQNAGSEQTSTNSPKLTAGSKLESFTKKLFNRSTSNASTDNAAAGASGAGAGASASAVDSPKKVDRSSSITWMENLW